MSHDNKGFTSDYDPNKGGTLNKTDNGSPLQLSPSSLYMTNTSTRKSPGKDLEAEQYDPYENREVPHPITNMDALFHMMKASCGTGILAMPLAFMHAGYAVGLVGTIFIGSICTYCVHILIQSEYELCRRRKIPSMTYPDIAYEAFREGPRSMRVLAPLARHSVNFFLMLYQIGGCGVYTLFIATNIKEVRGASKAGEISCVCVVYGLAGFLLASVFLVDRTVTVVDQYTPEDQHLDVKLYMCALLVPLILINWIRNLKLLAPCSTFAVAITILAFAVVLYYVFRGLPSLSEREPVGKITNLPLFFGTVIFALEAIGVIIPLENNMRTPWKFRGVFGVLNQGMVPIVFMYCFLGFFGYLRFGNEAAGSVTLNLPNEPLAESVKILIAVAIFGTHPLQCYVVIDIIWNIYLGPRLAKHPAAFYFEMLTRTAIVVISFLLAVAIPNLGPFISLIGALSLSMAGVFIPAICHLGTFWYEKEGCAFAWLLSKNIFFMLFALLGLVTGTYSSVLEIIGA